ncbi:zinc ribbon domain-containing protein [Providencia alcalifaciens]|uniref:Zinc-ribbon domain-containing protein n=1 Tax=Providencia alcalifaciens DSM 30120 TaxID=520999 RepID=B6XD93_9GAMM|nr:zinc ribbon domain-containing protein [Providencia alcalifaciens]ATG15199.1 zinc ribbon domain-containing protein [Providencia alcalifaciens]EEB46591.1 hypothetical protein PROVALCAL_01315 [Providencia alcalifaciens DSM 30120]MTC28634.1 zinc ribbon domain-containing protein [Providencia alcalifaciens]MTC29377.1 zinc ribbon domain-containing protein [Providencia alcalifaciens]MTC29435.1 zinc ribbon domain-containing protein [Providencia alcalifaciens]
MSIFSWLFNLSKHRGGAKHGGQYQNNSRHGSDSKHNNGDKHNYQDKHGYGAKLGEGYQYGDRQNAEGIICPQCRSIVSLNAKFCSECGTAT